MGRYACYDWCSLAAIAGNSLNMPKSQGVSYHPEGTNQDFPMAFPIRICSSCSEEFELKPNKPGFANRCPDCSAENESQSAAKKQQADSELNAARRNAMRDLLYRRDS